MPKKEKSQRYIIASIDVGQKNLAKYVESVDLDIVKELRVEYRQLPKNLQRRVKGRMNNNIVDLQNRLALAGKCLYLSVSDISSSDQPDPPYEIDTRYNLIANLETRRSLWSKCDIIIIEQQYFNTYSIKGRKKGGTEANIKAIKIAEGIFMWFAINFPDKPIEFFGSQYKTQILGAPDNLTKAQRKKWSKDRALSILGERNDEKTLNKIATIKRTGQKLDDMGDALIQCQAYIFRKMVGKF